MKKALILVLILTFALATGWVLDHEKLSALNKHLADQLAAKKKDPVANIEQTYAQLSAETSSKWEKASANEQAKEDQLKQELKAKDDFIAKLKSDGEEQKQKIVSEYEDKCESLEANNKTALDECRNNYDAVEKWNKIAIEKQRQLNELWSCTKVLYVNDAAAVKALGEPLYEAVQKTPASYAITGNGVFWADSPDTR